MNCLKCLLVTLALLSAVAITSAQPPIELKDGQYVVPLSVEATAPTKPALKYRLLPEVREMQSGNQVQGFYKCFFEQNYLFHNKESTDKQEKWRGAPLQDLATDKELIGYGGSAIKQAHYAARLDAVDWQLTLQAKNDGIMLLLPDVQQMRMLIGVLKVRFRGELARGEFDNAHYTLQTMFALSRMFNEHPTLIGHLVGIAITTITMGCLEEFVQQPGAPNLFWPLADLPAPFLDLRKGREGEKLMLTKEYELFRKATPVADAVLDELIKSHDAIHGPLRGLAKGDGPPAKDEDMLPSAWYAKQAADKGAVGAARDRLTALGHKVTDLSKLSARQLVMMDDFSQYQVALDEKFKWNNFPQWQLPADLDKQKPPPGVFTQFTPAWAKVFWARTRMQQQFGLLTTAEGIRATAAANGGKLPGSLAEVKLPLPLDPTTGKPFVYELKEGKAVVSCTPPEDQRKTPLFNRVYEITIRK